MTEQFINQDPWLDSEASGMAAKGDRYKCELCGVVCVIDEVCGCAECDLVCCGRPMKNIGKKARRKTAKKK